MIDALVEPMEYSSEIHHRGQALVAEAGRLIEQNPELKVLKDEMVKEFIAKHGNVSGWNPNEPSDLRDNALFDLFMGDSPLEAMQFDTPDGDVEKLIEDFLVRAKNHPLKKAS